MTNDLDDDLVACSHLNWVTPKHPKTTKTTKCISSFTNTQGLFVAIQGPTLMDLIDLLHINNDTMSVTLAFASLAYSIGGLLSGLLFNYVTRPILITILFCCFGLCNIVTPFITNYLVFTVITCFKMICAGGTDCGANVWILDIWPGRDEWLQAVHFTFAVGTALGPLIVEPFLSADYAKAESENGHSSASGLVGIRDKTSGSSTISDQNNETRIHVPFMFSGTLSILAGCIILFLHIKSERCHRADRKKLAAASPLQLELGQQQLQLQLVPLKKKSIQEATGSDQQLEQQEQQLASTPKSSDRPQQQQQQTPDSKKKRYDISTPEELARLSSDGPTQANPSEPKPSSSSTSSSSASSSSSSSQLSSSDHTHNKSPKKPDVDDRKEKVDEECKKPEISKAPANLDDSCCHIIPLKDEDVAEKSNDQQQQQQHQHSEKSVEPQLAVQIIEPAKKKITSRNERDNPDGRPPYYVMLAVALAAMSLSFYCGVEITSMNYLATFAVNIDLQLSKSTAALMSSALTISFAVGRGFGVYLGARMKPHVLFYICTSTMITGNILMLCFANTYEILLWCSVVVFGLGCAPLYPAVVSFFDYKITKVTNTVSGIFISGSMFNVALNSLIIGHHIIDNALILLFCNLAGSFVLLLLFGTLHMLTKLKTNQRVRKYQKRSENEKKLQIEQRLQKQLEQEQQDKLHQENNNGSGQPPEVAKSPEENSEAAAATDFPANSTKQQQEDHQKQLQSKQEQSPNQQEQQQIEVVTVR